MNDVIHLVTWKGTVKKYGYKEDGNKGTRFGIEFSLDGKDELQFVWCQTSLERKRLVKRIISLGAADGREFTIAD
jgi:hypothetical protein